MQENKKWYQSLTIQAAITLIIFAFAQVGIDISQSEITTVLTSLDTMFQLGTTVILSLASIYGRKRATTKIG